MADTTETGHPADDTRPLLENQDQSPSSRRYRFAWVRWMINAYFIARKASIISNTYPLLALVPLAICSGYLGWPSILTTVLNTSAIIPLSALVSYSSDLLSGSMGDIIGGLISATFGNTVELSVGILAVYHGEIHIAQTAMIGSILSDILLGLGTCIFTATHVSRHTITFNRAITDTFSSLMTITAAALIIPTTLYFTVSLSGSTDTVDEILAFSRGSSIVLLLLYLLYLYFQLGTHSSLFEPESSTTSDEAESDAKEWSNFAVLFAAAVGIVVCTHLLLDSIPDASKHTPLTKRFMAAIFVPIASNAPEFVTIFTITRRGRIDYVIGVIASSTLQIALLVIPLLVTLGWVLGQPMTLNFETFQTTLLFFTVLVVNRLLKDEEYTYLQGLVLLEMYAVITFVFYVHPDFK